MKSFHSVLTIFTTTLLLVLSFISSRVEADHGQYAVAHFSEDYRQAMERVSSVLHNPATRTQLRPDGWNYQGQILYQNGSVTQPAVPLLYYKSAPASAPLSLLTFCPTLGKAWSFAADAFHASCDVLGTMAATDNANKTCPCLETRMSRNASSSTSSLPLWTDRFYYTYTLQQDFPNGINASLRAFRANCVGKLNTEATSTNILIFRGLPGNATQSYPTTRLYTCSHSGVSYNNLLLSGSFSKGEAITLFLEESSLSQYNNKTVWDFMFSSDCHVACASSYCMDSYLKYCTSGVSNSNYSSPSLSHNCSTCQSSFCWKNVHCSPIAGEQIEQGCWQEGGFCNNSQCGFQLASNGTVCRVANGTCDKEEVCSGVSAICPVDEMEISGIVCRNASGICDVAEMCDGNSSECPVNAVQNSSVVCRNASGLCDQEERCDGNATSCPVDLYFGSNVTCRPSRGDCDVLEMCTGRDPDCPTDLFLSVLTVCRAKSGLCDIEERCNGTGPVCPPDSISPSGSQCRGQRGGCDAPENCDGVSKECPTDKMLSENAVCRAKAGPCDVAEVCDGTSFTCPDNVLEPSNTVCVLDDSRTICRFCTGTEVTCEAPAVECVPAQSTSTSVGATVALIVLFILCIFLALYLLRRHKLTHLDKKLGKRFHEELEERLIHLNDVMLRLLESASSQIFVKSENGQPSSIPARSSAISRRNSVAHLLTFPIFAPGDTLPVLTRKIFTFVESHLLDYVSQTLSQVYNALDVNLKIEGPKIFSSRVPEEYLEDTKKFAEKHGRCCWVITCVYPRMIYSRLADQRLKFFHSWKLRLEKLHSTSSMSIEQNKRVAAKCRGQKSGGDQELVSVEELQKYRIDPCIERQWLRLPGFQTSPGETVDLGGSSTNRRKNGGEGGGTVADFTKKELKEMNEIGVLPLKETFTPLKLEFVEDHLKKSRQQTDLSNTSTFTYDELPPFALTANEDYLHFSCSGLRDDIHLFFQAVKHVTVTSSDIPGDPCPHFEVYTAVRELDEKAKEWFENTTRTIAEREYGLWKAHFAEVTSAMAEEETEKAKAALPTKRSSTDDSQLSKSTTSEGSSPLFKNFNLREFLTMFQTRALEELKRPFEHVQEDPLTIKRSCCGHCIPEMPSIRTEIPTGDAAVEAALCILLKNLFYREAVQEIHLEEARQQLDGLRIQVLDCLYPPGEQEAMCGHRHPPHSTFVTWEDCINSAMVRTQDEADQLAASVVEREERRLGAALLMRNKEEGAKVKQVYLQIEREAEAFIKDTAHCMTLLKKCHRTARDICAVGRGLRGSAQGASSFNNLKVQLEEQLEILKQLTTHAVYRRGWINLQAVVASYNFYAQKLGVSQIKTQRSNS